MMPSQHLQDLDLVEQMLGGCEIALGVIRERHEKSLVNYLRRSGATAMDAEDMAQHVITDCLMGRPGKEPLLRKYTGRSSLEAWLKTVALNAWIDRQRRASRTVSLDGSAGEEAFISQAGKEAMEQRTLQEISFIELMRNALNEAFGARPGWEVVMLQLHHLHGLSQRELAAIWGWHETKVSRALSKSMESIASDTLAAVKRADPWLELRWEDFMELAGNFEAVISKGQ
jgi:RNA polymerase sigma factor (sigma-70 family)